MRSKNMEKRFEKQKSGGEKWGQFEKKWGRQLLEQNGRKKWLENLKMFKKVGLKIGK